MNETDIRGVTNVALTVALTSIIIGLHQKKPLYSIESSSISS